MSGRLDVGEAELRILLTILRRHVPDRTVWAFGSRVTGKAKPFSDLDLAVLCDPPLSIDSLAALNEALDWARTGPAFRQIIEAQHLLPQHGRREVAE